MQNILIPYDGSSQCIAAIKFAAAFFDGQRARFYFMPLIKTGNEDAGEVETNTATILKIPAGLVKRLTANGHRVKTIHTANLHYRTLRNVVELYGIHYMVMPLQGLRGCEPDKRDAIAEVITRVKCTILLVPEQCNAYRLKNFVIPTDFSTTYTQKPLEDLSNFALAKKTTLQVLDLSSQTQPLTETQESNKDYLKYTFKDIPHSFHFMKTGSMSTGLQQFLDVHEDTMIVLFAKGLNLLQRLWFNARAKNLPYPDHFPVLILHDK